MVDNLHAVLSKRCDQEGNKYIELSEQTTWEIDQDESRMFLFVCFFLTRLKQAYIVF